MKVLLVVTPPSHQSFGISKIAPMEPLAQEYVGAGIRGKHEVKLLDLRLDTEPTLKETLESFQPDIIGCGGYTMEANPSKKICAEAKKIFPGILTVVGGIHATVLPADFFEDYIDVVVMGEGVEPFRKICENHERRKSFAEVENIYYRDNGKMVFTRKEPYPPLDSLPFPDRTLTAHVRSKYQAIVGTNLVGMASIRGSAGCYFHCKFCSVSSIRNHTIYTRSIENIVEELKTIEENCIAWVDDELLIDPQRALTLAREIEKAGIKKTYACFGRADTIVNHPDVIEEWGKIGLEYIFVGMEAYRDKDLKEMKKGTNISKNDEAIRVCHKFGVKVRGGFMVRPDFEKKDFRSMARYIRKSGVDLMNITVYTPLPGTQLWEEKKAELVTQDYDFFDFVHPVLPTKIPLKDFFKEYFGVVVRAKSLWKQISLMMKMSPGIRKKFKNDFKTIEREYNTITKEYTALINKN